MIKYFKKIAILSMALSAIAQPSLLKAVKPSNDLAPLNTQPQGEGTTSMESGSELQLIHLPNEILIKVICFLNIEDINQLSRVSASFNQIIKHHVDYISRGRGKTLSLKLTRSFQEAFMNQDLTDEARLRLINAFIRMYVNVKSFQFDDSLSSDFITSVMPALVNAQRIDFCVNSNLTNENLNVICQHVPNLKFIDLGKSSATTDAGLAHFILQASQLEKILAPRRMLVSSNQVERIPGYTLMQAQTLQFIRNTKNVDLVERLLKTTNDEIKVVPELIEQQRLNPDAFQNEQHLYTDPRGYIYLENANFRQTANGLVLHQQDVPPMRRSLFGQRPNNQRFHPYQRPALP